MSYILDALRRADAERALGDVPTLHAAPAPWLDDPGAPGETRRPGLSLRTAAGVAVLAAAVVATVAWWLWPSPSAPGLAAIPGAAESPEASRKVDPPLSFAPAPAPAAVAEAARPELAATGSVPQAAAPVASAPRPARPDRVADASLRVEPRPTPAGRPPSAAAAEAPRAQRSASAPEARRPEAAKPPAPSSATAVERIPRLEELTPDQRQGLPAFAVSGAVYSADPASRMLILNGQLVREGDRLSADLMLLRIQPKSAVLESRGQRFSISF